DADLLDAAGLDAAGSRKLDRHVRAAALHRLDRGAELDHDARFPKRLLDERARARILSWKHSRLAFDEHDLDPEPAEGLRELATYRTRSEDPEPLRPALQVEDRLVRQRPALREPANRRKDRMGARRDHGPPGHEPRGADLHGGLVDE